MSHRTSPSLALHLLVACTLSASACRTRLVEPEAAPSPRVVACSDPILVGVKLTPSVLWVGTGDFNGDGKPDLVGASEGISFTFGRGDGTFGPATDPVQTGLRTYAAIADFDGDGVDDVVSYRAHEPLKLHQGVRSSEQPRFIDAAIFSTLGALDWIAAGDVDSDGRSDAVLVSKFVGPAAIKRERNIDGTHFAGVGFQNFEGQPHGFVMLADLDGDHRLDVLTPVDSNVLVHNARSWSGQSAPVVGVALPAPASSLVTADFDEDGVPDLAAVATLMAGSNVFVAHGHGDGTFAAPGSLRAGQSPHAAVAVDWNVDGHLDLAVANSGADHTVTFLYGRGDGTFSDPQHCFAVTFEANGGPNWITTADFNLDGRPDLAFAYHDGLDVVLNQLK